MQASVAAHRPRKPTITATKLAASTPNKQIKTAQTLLKL